MERENRKAGKKQNNQGSAMIMALAIISFVAILGALSLSTALLNLKMRSLNRKSDRNFYYLETALDEIYARTGVETAELLKNSYAKTVGELYQGDLVTNAKANQVFSKDAMEGILAHFELNELKSFPLTPQGILISDDEALCSSAADLLKEYSETFKDKNLDVSIEEIIVERRKLDNEEPDENKTENRADPEENSGDSLGYSTLIFKGLCLTYTEAETAIQSSLTVDLRISVPYIRFMNEGDALFDYVLAANGGIRIGEPEAGSGTWGGDSGEYDVSIQGNVYGGSIDINKAYVRADSSLLTSKETLKIRNQGKLAMGYFGGSDVTIESEESGSADEGRRNSVWAKNLELNFNSELFSDNTDFYIQDDLTLKNDKNFVQLDGRYYGYGNEGLGETRLNVPSNSSAILMNDKNSTIDMEGLDTLMLAGRAYLNFDLEGKNPQYVYPMGESLAVRATQAMYLIPETDITLSYVGGLPDGQPAGSNPVVLPEGVNTAVVTVSVPEEITGNGAKEETIFTISRKAPQASEPNKTARIMADSPDSSHALMIELNGKFYLYYDFDSNFERTEYFERYLKEKGDNFDDYLRKSGVTGEHTAGEDGGVRINESGRIVTSGALYQVTGTDPDGNGHLFQLFELKKGETGDTLKWPELSKSLEASFENLQKNLAETLRIRERTGPGIPESGISEASLPVGNYVNLQKISDELKDDPYYSASLADGESAVFLSADDLTVTLGGGSAEIEVQDGHGSSYTVSGGLIVTSKNITVKSSGGSGGSDAVFRGLMLAGGTIDIVGKAEFTAEPEMYQAVLDDEEVSKYFYDYGIVTSAAFSDYTDFVTRENWVRAGRETGGEEE